MPRAARAFISRARRDRYGIPHGLRVSLQGSSGPVSVDLTMGSDYTSFLDASDAGQAAGLLGDHPRAPRATKALHVLTL